MFLITLTPLGFVNASLCSNYGNCLHDSAVSIKLNLLLAMMRFLYVVELTRGRVFGWIPWLINIDKMDFYLLAKYFISPTKQASPPRTYTLYKAKIKNKIPIILHTHVMCLSSCTSLSLYCHWIQSYSIEHTILLIFYQFEFNRIKSNQ